MSLKRYKDANSADSRLFVSTAWRPALSSSSKNLVTLCRK